MMQIKLTRDQARTLQQNFLIYLILLARMKIRDSKRDLEKNLSCRVIKALLLDIKKKFEKKLLNQGNTLHFKFTDAEGIVLYELIEAVPVDSKDFWKYDLRLFVRDTLLMQIPDDEN